MPYPKGQKLSDEHKRKIGASRKFQVLQGKISSPDVIKPSEVFPKKKKDEDKTRIIRYSLNLSGLNNTDIIYIHTKLHKMFKDGDSEWTSDEIAEFHVQMTEEMKSRELKHMDIDELDEHQQGEKLTNQRSNLREANPDNRFERCGSCIFFTSPEGCKIIQGLKDEENPMRITEDLVCDWIQSRGNDEAQMNPYMVNDRDWEAFGRGMVKKQPYQHIVRDAAITPEGPLVMIEDTAEPNTHKFSLGKDFHIGHTTLEHHWTQEEVDELIRIGKEDDESDEVDNSFEENQREPTTVQTFIFSKSEFTRSETIAWAKRNNRKFGNVEETEDSFRLQQIDEDNFKPDSFRTIDIDKGVKAVIGRLKESNEKENGCGCGGESEENCTCEENASHTRTRPTKPTRRKCPPGMVYDTKTKRCRKKKTNEENADHTVIKKRKKVRKYSGKFALVSHQIGPWKHLELKFENGDHSIVWIINTPEKPASQIKIGFDPIETRKKSKEPIAKLEFEGVIPRGQFGASRNYAAIVKLLDKGTYEIKEDEPMFTKFTLNGNKMKGMFEIRRSEDVARIEHTKYQYDFKRLEERKIEKNVCDMCKTLSKHLEVYASKETRTKETLTLRGLKISQELKKGEMPKSLMIKAIALKEGTWNGLFYPREELKKFGEGLKGVPLMVDHSKSVRDIVGEVLTSEYDESQRAIIIEARVDDPELIKLILDKKVNGVSVGVFVERIRENGRLVARDYDFAELSIVIVPACDKCEIVEVHPELSIDRISEHIRGNTDG